MVFSGLFQDKFIDQVQVVAYLHQWEAVDAKVGGEFVYYNNDTSVGHLQPKPNSGSFLDGSKMIHAAKVYKPDVKAPRLDKDKDSALVYEGNDIWAVKSGGEAVAQYTTNDLRIALVYRARCFPSEKESIEYSKETEVMNLDEILRKLSSGLSKPVPENRLELALAIIDKYISYPLALSKQSWFPFNYCIIFKDYPWLKFGAFGIC